ncbi:MAG TPA: PEP-CTERM sorting domain-containing protein [Pirellulales bacterium]
MTGTNQQVGAITGTGDTVVSAGASLTANSIVQNALVIGGTSTSPATVAIAASDASGNPLAVASAAASGSLIAGATSPSNFVTSSAGPAGSLASLSLGLQSSALGGPGFGASAAVPEPSTVVLMAIAAVAGLCSALRVRNLRRQ